jgi:hypothetical protein
MLTAKRTPNVSPLSKTAKRNVEQSNPVGLFVSLERAAKPQSTRQNVPLPTDVSEPPPSKRFRLPLPLLTPNSASRRNAPTNGLPAKKTPNASPLFRTAKRSVEQANLAGLSVSLEKAAKPQSMLQNVLTAITASVLLQKQDLPSQHLMNAS